MRYVNSLTAGTAFAALVITGMSVISPTGRAANDNNGAQDEKQMIQTGLALASTIGIRLNMSGKDPDMFGLGSYLVNTHDCNGCHTADPSTEFTGTGNPYLLRGPNQPPFFNGLKQYNPKTYLGGGSDFGSFGPGPAAEIISRNITPDKTGLPEGGHTLTNFIQIIRTGVDLDHAHPSCSATITNNCLAFPFNGDLLQVMPWSSFQDMTDRQLTAIYTYLSAVPCLEGGPGEPAHRCS